MDGLFEVRNWRRVPWLFCAAAAGLLAVGYSALQRGDELTGEGQTAARQLFWVGLSLPVCAMVLMVSYRRLERLAVPAYAVTLVLLVAVFAMPIRHGSRRWIPLGVFDLQPSELAKLATVLTLAWLLRSRGGFRTLPGLIAPTLVAFVPMGLILKEPDLGTALVFLPVWFAMLFAAGARPRHLAAAVLAGVIALPVLWSGMSAEQRSRVVAVFTQRDGGPTPRGDGYHLFQSKRMLAAGGLWGSEFAGMSSDDPAVYHLPAGRTDFIFCLVGERWGLAGCLATLGLYALLIARGLRVALRCREPFGRLVVTGFVTLVATQVAINTGMTVGLMPITGLTLPLLSYGGSSLLTTLVSLALVVNVALRPGNELGPMPFRFEAGGTRPVGYGGRRG